MFKRNRTKYRLIEAHIKAVEDGDYEVARKILRLLRKKRTAVGLDDVSHKVETIAENCGCRINYTRSFCTAEIRF